MIQELVTQDRRRILDRRHRLASLIDLYRWLSAVTLKVFGVIAFVMLAMGWYQKSPSRHTHSGARSGEAAYHWQGYHRIG